MKRFLFALGICFAAGCKPPAPPSAPAKPAAVVAKEGDLLTVTLTAEAEARLGIRTEEVALRKVARVRLLSGEALVPPGRELSVTAPLAGVLGGEPPAAGVRVSAGQGIFTLTPLLSAESRVATAAARSDAEGAIRSAQIQIEAAKPAVARAERLLEDKAGSRRAVEEARTQLAGAEAARAVAVSRRDALNESLGILKIASPIAGLLRRIQAGPGQTVTAGAPLFEVAALDRLWIRVPLHVADIDGVDAAREILIEGVLAKPAAAPPTADPAGATVDLVYEVDNAAGRLRPGQKLSVSVPLRTEEESRVVPWSAVIHDVHGGTWIYERTGERSYVRRRISIRQVTDGRAVLVSGPGVGAKAVSVGAAELYGTEFGHAK